MKVIYKSDDYKKEYEICGIVIFYKESQEDEAEYEKTSILYLLENNWLEYSNDVIVVDNRIPFNWHIKILNNISSYYYALIGLKEFVYSFDLIDCHRQACEEAVIETSKILKKNKAKKWQEELDFYDKYLDYKKIMEEMKYTFLDENEDKEK